MKPTSSKLLVLSLFPMIAAATGCKPRSFNQGKIRSTQTDGAGFEDVKTLNRDVRFYSWVLVNPPAATTAADYLNSLKIVSSAAPLPDGSQPPLLKVAEDNRSAMGAASYFAFSPTESMQFGFSKDGKQEGVMRSFMMPAGSKYIVAAHPSFLARANEFFKKSSCKALPFEASMTNAPPFTAGQSLVGLKGIQGIFRSCPEVKLELLKDSNGRRVDFVVYPEVNTYNYDDQGTYKERLAYTRVDRTFPTQAKPRWAILTNLPDGKEQDILKSIKIWSQSSGLKIGDESASTSYNQNMLHCAVEEGSKWPRMSRTIQWSNGRNYPAENVSAFLGLGKASATEISKSVSEFTGQAAFKTIDSYFYTVQNGESGIDGKLRSGSPRCPTLYHILHGTDAAQKQFANDFVKGKLLDSSVSGSHYTEQDCPAIPRSLALGVANVNHELPLAGATPADYADPKSPACLDIYKEYLSTVVPATAKAYQDCKSAKPQIVPLKIPNSTCSPAARSELLQQSFLSAAQIDTDLGPDERGDELNFLMN